MAKTAVFVDAGYLFGGGSDLLFGKRRERRDLVLHDPADFVREALAQVGALDLGSIELFRTYWYDGAPGGLATKEHVAIGQLPRFKLRLGRVSAGGQKGVDGLIILDLITLTTNRAIDMAVLLSGDEDLREATLFAQGHGVTFVLLGLQPTTRQRQSELLIREADYHLVLDATFVARHLGLVEPTVVEAAVEIVMDADSDRVIAAPSADVVARHGPEAAEELVAEPEVLVEPAGEVPPALDALVDLADEVVSDARFAGGGLVDDSGAFPRLTREADKLLVARLASLTGIFPVDSALLRRARRLCIDLASGRGGEPCSGVGPAGIEPATEGL